MADSVRPLNIVRLHAALLQQLYAPNSKAVINGTEDRPYTHPIPSMETVLQTDTTLALSTDIRTQDIQENRSNDARTNRTLQRKKKHLHISLVISSLRLAIKDISR